jgi:hypothetical protein
MIMTILPLVAAVLLASLPAEDPTSRDGLLTDAAAVPTAGTVRAGAGTGTTQDTESGATTASVTASVLWSFAPGFAATLAASNEGGSLTPAAGLRWQFLSQHGAPVDAVATVRFKSVGLTGVGDELELGANLGRTFGHLDLVANGVAGREFSGGGTDVEGRGEARWAFANGVLAGVEARVRAEVAEPAAVPVGRTYDLTVGPALSFHADYVCVQALAGWGVPRGLAQAGPVVMALLTTDF